MLKKALVGFVILLVAFFVFVALQEADFRIERQISINAPAEIVFAQVNDLRKFDVWNPWSKLDPAMKQNFEGSATGVGAVSRWEGNSQVGAGSMTITESQSPSLVRMRLAFLRPFEVTNTAEFTFNPEGSQTVVTWAMSGQKNFISKLMCLFMSMDKMVGGDFEKGLAQLQTIVETSNNK